MQYDTDYISDYMQNDLLLLYEETATGKAVETSVHTLRVDGIDGNVSVEPERPVYTGGVQRRAFA